MLISGSVGIELKKLSRQSACYVCATLASLAIGFVSFPVYTRAFSVADYGAIDFVQKIVLLFTAASKMGQQNSALRFYDGSGFSADPSAARRYYSTMFFGMGITASAVSLIFGVGLKLTLPSFIDQSFYALLWFALALIFIRALQSVLFSFLRIEERTKIYATASVAIKAVTVAGVCFLLPLAGRSAHTFFSASVTTEAAAVAVFTLFLLRRGLLAVRSFDVTMFRAALAFGLPLIVYEMATLILDSGDRVLVRSYLGAEALGRYSVAYGLSGYANELLIAPLNLALLPIYMRIWRTEGPRKTSEFLSTGLDLFLMAACVILALSAALSRDCVTLLASSKYAGVYVLMPTIVGGLLIYTTHIFFAAGPLIYKNTRTMAVLLALSAILNLGLNCLLLPIMGLQAAALATLISYLFCVLLLARASFRILPLEINYRAFCWYMTAAALAWAAASIEEPGTPIASLFLRGITVVLVYGGLLYLADKRIRLAAAYVLARLGGRPSLPVQSQVCEQVEEIPL